LTDQVESKQEPAPSRNGAQNNEAPLRAERAKNEASGALKNEGTRRGLGHKLETYGLIFVAVVTAIFYIFWLVLFCVGTTRLPHN